mgnify:CR=1 FL=1
MKSRGPRSSTFIDRRFACLKGDVMKIRIEAELTPIPSSSSYSLTGVLLLIGDTWEEIPIPIPSDTPTTTLPKVLRLDIGEQPRPRPAFGAAEKKRGWMDASVIKKLREIQPEGFDEWYKIYPRKVGRVDAEKAFANLFKKGVDLELLMQATRGYAVQCEIDNVEPKFIKLPASFLRNERWRDYVPHTNKKDLSD